MVKKALALDPELAEAHLSLGRVYDFEKKYKEAIIEFKRVIELRPNSNDAYRRLGYVYQNGLYDYPEAIKFFQKALTIRPTDAKSYRGLGQSYASLRRYNESIRVIKKGLELSPDDVYLLVFLGDAYRLQGMFEQSMGVYKKASEYHPDDHVISYYLGGYVYYSKKDYNEAIRIFEKSIHQGMQEFMVLIYIASIYQHKGETQKANVIFDSSVTACKKVLEKEPQNTWALSHLGISYASLGNRREAMEKGREAVAIEPSAAQIYNLSMIYLILKKDDLALTTLERACLKDPSYIDIAALEPDFERLKDYSEFQKLLKNRP